MMRDRLQPLVQDHPDRLAVDAGLRQVTFAELLASVERLLPSLGPRTVVASVLSSGPDFTAAHLAAIEAGAIFVPLPHRSTAAELERAFDLVRPDVVLVELEGVETVRAAMGERPGRLLDPAAGQWLSLGERGPRPPGDSPLPEAAVMVQFTSGSTGVPKGILLSAAGIAAGIDQNRELLERFRGQAVFSPMPQFHAMGGAVVLEHVLYGASVLISNRFVPGDDKRRIDGAAAALLVGSPSYLRMLQRLGMLKKLRTVQAVCLGSAASEPALLADVRRDAPPVSIHLRYGLSEAFGTLTRLDVEASDPLPQPGLVGPALAGVSLDALPPAGDGEPQEVKAQSTSVGLGVVNPNGDCDPLVDQQGWLSTGDLGYSSDAGLVLRGRLTQFLKRNGHRIDPSEIEQVLLGHPDISEVSVVGVPDPVAETKIIAVFEGSANGGQLDERCRSALSDHKVPQQFVNVPELPRTASGKPDRPRIRAMFTKDAGKI